MYTDQNYLIDKLSATRLVFNKYKTDTSNSNAHIQYRKQRFWSCWYWSTKYRYRIKNASAAHHCWEPHFHESKHKAIPRLVPNSPESGSGTKDRFVTVL